MKKSKILFVLFLSLLLIGCGNSNKESSDVVISNGDRVNTKKMEHKHCTRKGDAGTGVNVSLNYDIYYTGDILNLLVSEEKISSADDSVLTTYEDAYKGIQSNYIGLEYYDQEVSRGDTTVINKITINYDKIDIDKLIAIEGETDNIFENKVPKVDKWLELAKKFGTKCELVEE